MTDRKKLEKYLIIGAIAIFAIISATYAYFQAQLGNGASANVDLDTSTTDSLTFDVGDDISLSINQFNFGVGAGNLTSNTTASATLLANNASNTATYNYYVYFRINSNEFVYTTEDNKPEIILTVTDPEGNPVTSIDGLTYVPNVQTTTSDGSTQTVSGFDITTASGTFVVASAYSITANSTTPTTQNWNFTATFINLDSDQQGNTDKSMDAEIIIQQEELKPTLADYITNLYTEDGVNGLYYHDGVGSYTNADQEAGDNSYRYAGANPNNYVCFGSDEETCPADNLYRIIGVFDGQVKLIKHDYAGESTLGTAPASNGTPSSSYYKGSLSSIPNYYWSGSSSNRGNTWSNSTLNTEILNGTYLNTMGSEWSSKIATTIWKVGGMSSSSTNTAKQCYITELGSSSSSTTYNAKIGLMYVSEYGYAASPENWNTASYNYDNDTNRNNNWMYMGVTEWTISRRSSGTGDAFYVYGGGSVVSNGVHYGSYGVRPSFSLESDVVLSGGTGSASDPFRIA